MNKKKIVIALNILIIILEIIGIILSYKISNRLLIEYYTEDSNIFTLIVCLINLLFILLRKKIPRWLNILKHMSVLGLSITFLVVIFILAPMYKFDYKWLLLTGSMLYFHTLCPILLFVSYIFFEKEIISKKDLPYTMLFTIIYSIILITCNIAKIIEGPYPFLMVYKQPIYMSILWIILLDGGAYLLSKGLYKIKKIKQ